MRINLINVPPCIHLNVAAPASASGGLPVSVPFIALPLFP